ncbi:MAG: hypothetical protein ACHQK8_04045 [Bacteroidia bacterium]
MRYLILLSFSFLISKSTFSQGCCSGGSGSPIAGGASQGVLLKGQVELGANYQYANSDKFYSGDKDTASLLKSLSSNYLYLRIGYGITEKLSLSIEGGYFFDKTLVGLHPDDPYVIDNTKKSSGVSDLIIFPRYDVFNHTNEDFHTEVTLGVGLKIPIGKYYDSIVTFNDPSIPLKISLLMPPTVQPSTGAYDFIFYGFALNEFKHAKFKVFANALYIRKGWNSLGEKFGDYTSVGLFAGKTFFKKLGVTLQLKGEWIGPLQLVPDAIPSLMNVDPASTGSKKISFVPQLSYNFKSFTLYSMCDLPLYQYMNGLQIGSKYLITTGLSYRFMPMKNLWKKAEKAEESEKPKPDSIFK